MKRLRIFAFAALAIAATAFAVVPGLRLMPGTVGKGAVARWIKFGSNTNHALYLSKNVPTSDFEAAGADISGVAGKTAGDLTTLGWTLLDGSNEGGSPRWNIYLDTDDSGDYTSGDLVVFLDHNTAGGDDDVFGAAEIQAQVLAQGGSLDDKILYLQIIVDVQHAVVLDDIKVGFNDVDTTFSGPGKSD